MVNPVVDGVGRYGNKQGNQEAGTTLSRKVRREPSGDLRKGPPEMRERLEFLKSTSGLTAADVLRIGLDLAQPAIEEAFNVGYGDAEWRLKVTYWCSGCGRDDVSVETPAEAESVGEFLSQNGWHCPQCR